MDFTPLSNEIGGWVLLHPALIDDGDDDGDGDDDDDDVDDGDDAKGFNAMWDFPLIYSQANWGAALNLTEATVATESSKKWTRQRQTCMYKYK